MPLAATSEPTERVAFFDEQRRNRRATWRLAAASALGVALMGLPVSVVVTPLVCGVALILFDTITLVVPVPAAVAAAPMTAAHLMQRVIDRLSGDVPPATVSNAAVALFAVALFAPGVVAMIALWGAIRRLMHDAGVGALLLKLGARAPRPDELAEHQLDNIVQEMAIAAGVAPPRLAVIDGPASNAALIGSPSGTATIVVSRGLLDACTRDETQAVIGHLVGSLGNGDLRIAFTMASVFETCGLLAAILEAPFSARSSASLRRLARILVRRRRDDAADVDLIGALLVGRLFDNKRDEGAKDPPAILAPLVLASVSVSWTMYVFITFVVGPAIALLWRARRYLADATAVQLTRNPDALWRALVKCRGTIDGADAASYLCIVASRADALGTSSFVRFHPTLERRLARLEAEGATPRFADTHPAHTRAEKAVYAIFATFVSGLFAVAGLAALAGVALFVFIAMFFVTFALFAIHAAFLLLGALKRAALGF